MKTLSEGAWATTKRVFIVLLILIYPSIDLLSASFNPTCDIVITSTLTTEYNDLLNHMTKKAIYSDKFHA